MTKTRGRKSKLNFEGIADRYNLVYSSHWASVDASEVQEDIRRNETLFAHLVSRRSTVEAYFYLKLVLQGQMSEDEVQRRSRPSPADVPLLETFHRSKDYEPRLPSWFVEVLTKWLLKVGEAWQDSRQQVEERPPESPVPRWLHYSDPISLSFYVMADCLRDEAFVWAMKRVRTIWRMDSHDPESWYRWLYDQQASAVRKLSPKLTQRDAVEKYSRYGQGHNMGWANPLDDRDVHGDLDDEAYGLPVLDYKSHLRQLVRLAGGDPGNDLWEEWVEALLWELRPRPGRGGGWAKGDTTWLRREALSPVWDVDDREVTIAPPTIPTVVTERSPDGEVRLRIAIPSRWFSLSSFPLELRDDLLQATLRLWGAYRHLLSHEQRLAYLAGLALPSREETPDREWLLRELYEETEAELEALPIEDQVETLTIQEQEAMERRTVRRPFDRQRKKSERARKRLQT
ncbi:MAG: hypothetical protein MUP14_08965 [Dehalococcoidia bacterium]|nr:hypothetical protein [Dehalococcoidia bacterium]